MQAIFVCISRVPSLTKEEVGFRSGEMMQILKKLKKELVWPDGEKRTPGTWVRCGCGTAQSSQSRSRDTLGDISTVKLDAK